METARIERRIGVRATPEHIWGLIADLPGWSRWNPIETGLEGAIAFGAGISLTETIKGLPERRVAARVGDWQPYSQLVWTENRGLWSRSVRYFEIQPLDEPNACIAANGFIFSGLRGEMFFDTHRARLRHSVDAVADAWKAAAEA
ncbi:MAG: SRPBCC domain-containing protein [Brevundimonas sp.]|uniref:SRPBCC domain-containing protein n=1 Tax=Brevundimonas sp. TaxID=1871086 RepID=UPI002488D502|nr:SRPBCC domain-containing protein [Brevundimonas sp.]MDI1327125.1 SRPBCC domain-containing protein [Brevundimonas sp.]